MTIPNPILHRPRTTNELADAVREHAAASSSIRIAGAGTATDWGGRSHPSDAVLETTALTGTLSYAPEDMTVSVRAGTTLESLQQSLAEHGQRVSFDPARAGATIGGLVATADGGPLRQAFGTLRALVIGITFVTADGTIVHSGGQVIKNVAGYDLAKLLHGSLGTLGAIAEVVLRLHPRPQNSVTISVPTDPAAALSIARAAVAAAIEPSALEWCDGTLLIRLEGTAAGTRAGTKQLLELTDGAEVVSGAVETDRWAAVAATATGDPGDTVARIGTAPKDTPWALERSSELAHRHAVTVQVSSSVGIGVHNVRIRSGLGEARLEYLAALRDELDTRNGTMIVTRPGDLPVDATTRGRPPEGIAVMQAIKKRFDPQGQFGAGRFAPWF